MVKISGTENLKAGEFRTDIYNNSNKIYKAFLILDEANKKKQLPECNQVYRNLKHILVDKKFFIEIKEKVIKEKANNVKKLLQYVTKKINKGCYTKLEQNISWNTYIKMPTNTVLNEITGIKKLAQIEEIPIGNVDFIHGDNSKNNDEELYKQICTFIYNHHKENGLIPEGIEKEFGITKREKNKIIKKAREERLLIKINARRHKVNPECEGWEEIV